MKLFLDELIHELGHRSLLLLVDPLSLPPLVVRLELVLEVARESSEALASDREVRSFTLLRLPASGIGCDLIEERRYCRVDGILDFL
jgi:hypothetical protein